jgi:4-hydroxybenzoate polyprenyltransferase
MKLGKKSAGDLFWTSWPELFFIFLIVIGFVVSIIVRNPTLSYIVMFCGGLMGGRLIAKKIKKQPLFPYFLIVLGFLFGYLLGSFTIKINRLLLILLFVIGGIVSYILHKKEIIK